MGKEQQTVTSAIEKSVESSSGCGGLKIACVALAIMTLGLGTYLILDKTVLARDSDNGTNKCVTTSNEKAATENIGFVYDTSPIGTYIDYGKYIVTKDGSLYFEPNSEISWSEESTIKTSYLVNDETGTKGKFTFEQDDIGYEVSGALDTPVTIDGYKLNVSNVQSVIEIGHGQQKVGILLAIIDKDGNLSILKTKDGFGENVELVLEKNVEKNVASVGTAYAWSYRYAVVYFRDGGSKKLDDKVFE